MKEKVTSETIRKYWDSRSVLGHTSGSNDFILKDLETVVLLEHIAPNSTILDVGCGNGETLIKLATEKGCSGTGIDFSAETIRLANKNCGKANLEGQLVFKTAQVPGGLEGQLLFDYAITQRCLVNLTSKEDQRRAFSEIMSHVKPGGYYLMIEDSQQGLHNLNVLRCGLDLEPILPPWHNLFLNDVDVSDWQTAEWHLVEGPKAVASTYYFLSRVIYAKIAADQGLKPEELRYDSEINLLAYRLPQYIGDWGAPKIWIWKRDIRSDFSNIPERA